MGGDWQTGGLGQPADLRRGLAKKEQLVFLGGLIPNAHYEWTPPFLKN